MKYSVLVNAVIIKDNKVLISKRSANEKHQAGKWTIPGGKMEEEGVVFNAIEKTAEREVLEETGLEVVCEKVFMNNTFTHNEDGYSVLAIITKCKHINGEAKPLEDTDEIRWVDPRELDDYDFSPNICKYIKEAFNSL